MAKQYINIQYPFTNSDKGHLVTLTETDNDAIKSDLMHLILTTKGQRFYLPDFGTNLMKHIFEPLDSATKTSIDLEIREAVKQFIPNLNINEVEVKSAEDLRDEENTQEEDPTRDQKTFSFSDKKHGANEFTLRVRIDYSIGSGVFEARDFVLCPLPRR